MGKIEKNITKMIKKQKIENLIEFVTHVIKEKTDDEIAEAIFNFGPVFLKVQELNLKFPSDLFELLISKLNDPNWIIRRNVIKILGDVAQVYIEKVLDKDVLNQIKLKATKDQHWAVRVDGIKTLGKMGLQVPDKSQIIVFMVNQCTDPDPEIRLAALETLAMLLKEAPDKIKENLHVFVSRFKTDDDYRVSLLAEGSIKEFAEMMKH